MTTITLIGVLLVLVLWRAMDAESKRNAVDIIEIHREIPINPHFDTTTFPFYEDGHVDCSTTYGIKPSSAWNVSCERKNISPKRVTRRVPKLLKRMRRVRHRHGSIWRLKAGIVDFTRSARGL